MRGADQFQFQLVDFADGSPDLVFERAHDAVEIEMKILGEVRNLIIKEFAGAVMSTEGITGKKDGVLNQVGEHGIRPMQIRSQNKTQGTPTKVNFIAITDNLGIERPIQQLGEKILRRTRTVNR